MKNKKNFITILVILITLPLMYFSFSFFTMQNLQFKKISLIQIFNSPSYGQSTTYIYDDKNKHNIIGYTENGNIYFENGKKRIFISLIALKNKKNIIESYENKFDEKYENEKIKQITLNDINIKLKLFNRNNKDFIYAKFLYNDLDYTIEFQNTKQGYTPNKKFEQKVDFLLDNYTLKLSNDKLR